MRLLITFFASPFGGAEKALLNLSKELLKTDIDVTYLFTKRCYLSDKISEYDSIKLLPSKLQKFFMSKKDIKNPGDFFKKIHIKMLDILNMKEKQYVKELKKSMPLFNVMYDETICFFQDISLMQLVLYAISSKHKSVVLHNSIQQSNYFKKIYPYFGSFDTVYCVSNSCKDELVKDAPQLRKKVDVLYNAIDVEEIKNKSTESLMKYESNVINILSVGRLAEEKAYLRSLKIFKELHAQGLKFCWHILGIGELYEKITEYINVNDMSTYVKLHGFCENPYPYIKDADLLYLGSLHEAAPMVYAEAMILGVPVVSTRTTSADEIVGEYGFVCDNNEMAIYEMLKYILQNNEEIERKRKKLIDYQCKTNELVVNKIKEKMLSEK